MSSNPRLAARRSVEEEDTTSTPLPAEVLAALALPAVLAAVPEVAGCRAVKPPAVEYAPWDRLPACHHLF